MCENLWKIFKWYFAPSLLCCISILQLNIPTFIASHFQMKFFPIKRAVLSTSVLLVDTLLNQLMYDCEEKYFLEEKKENLIVSTFVLMFWCLNLENTSYVSNEKRRLALEVIYIWTKTRCFLRSVQVRKIPEAKIWRERLQPVNKKNE